MTINLSIYLTVSLRFCLMNFDSIRFIPLYLFLMDDAVSLLPFRMHSFLKSTLCCVHATFLMLFFPHIYSLCACLLMCMSACMC